MEGLAATWSRTTPWYQGAILTIEAAQTLRLSHPGSPGSTCVIVISHDCDLANDALQIEPDVEVINGCRVDKGDGNYFWAKSPRTLHLKARHNDVDVVIELVATAKQLISKQSLARFSPDTAYSLSNPMLSALRSWLCARYNRSAFPDPFVNFLSESRVDKHLAKIIEPTGDLLSAVYFDCSGDAPYKLKIILAYPPGDNPEKTYNDVEQIRKRITELFEKNFYNQKSDEWNKIALDQCISISEDDLRVSQTRLLVEWRLEYMTIKADDEPTELLS